jgi:histidyl-tRNA synthetase
MSIPNEINLPVKVKGTRILYGNLASEKRALINRFFYVAINAGFVEIELPSIEKREIYQAKVGNELENQMYTVGDEFVLRPEGTATCQLIAQQFKFDKDVKLAYCARCWRKETAKLGRYREFTQFGVEILNPRKDYTDELVTLAEQMFMENVPSLVFDSLEINKGVRRGLSYYTGEGFEFRTNLLPQAESQLVGGGPYAEGIGFAIGVDRVLTAYPKEIF